MIRTPLVIINGRVQELPQGDSIISTTVSEEDMLYSKRIDFITDTLLYKGEALVGSSESSPIWRIRRITIGNDNDVTEVWAEGTANFDKIWANRAALSYS